LGTDFAYQNSKVVFDAGCGSGAYGIRRANEGYAVVGMDISAGMAGPPNDGLRKMKQISRSSWVTLKNVL